MEQVGLRIDVDAFHGTRDGVPRLLDLLGQHGTQASFLFSVGPGNMGRYLQRLVKPKLLWKMLRPKATSLYGWDILLADTAWPGYRIGAGNKVMIRVAVESHEIGLHARGHYSWQTWGGAWSQERLALEVERGLFGLKRIIGRPITYSAVAGWCADQQVVKAKESFGFLYNSDCRDTRPSLPQLGSGMFGTVQIPVTLPTWDEAAGTAVDIAGFNRYLLGCIRHDPDVSAYTIHTEMEGTAYADQFNELLAMTTEEEIRFCPPSQLLPTDFSGLPSGEVIRGELTG